MTLREPIPVMLTYWEWRVCRFTATERDKCADAKGWETKFDCPDRHLIGCLTELAGTKHTNCYWEPFTGNNRREGDFKLHDGTPVEVKGRRTHLVRKSGNVLSRDAFEDRLYLFTSVEPPADPPGMRRGELLEVLVWGWLHGSMVASYPVEDPNNYGVPCHVIPVNDLLPDA